MRIPLISLGVFVVASSALVAQSYPPAFPRPNATKLLETDQIVVWRMVWPKGQPTVMHRHLYDQVGTYYEPGGRIITSPDGSKREGFTPVGNLSTTRKGTTHIEEGSTDPPLRAVFIELLRDGTSGPAETHASSSREGVEPGNGATPLFPREGAKQILDDERVTVWDYVWPAGSSTAAVRYPRNAVTVWLGSGSVRVTDLRRKTDTLAVAPGQIRYVPAGTVESFNILTGSPRAMLFEFK
jgi:hypothetical protein